MSEPTRQPQLDRIHAQLEDWQHYLALRVAGEAEALDVEVDKLHNRELGEATQRLTAAHTQILAGCDTTATSAADAKTDSHPDSRQDRAAATPTVTTALQHQNRARDTATVGSHLDCSRQPHPAKESSPSGDLDR